jgi:hypothetical protein
MSIILQKGIKKDQIPYKKHLRKVHGMKYAWDINSIPHAPGCKASPYLIAG